MLPPLNTYNENGHFNFLSLLFPIDAVFSGYFEINRNVQVNAHILLIPFVSLMQALFRMVFVKCTLYFLLEILFL